jgi:hypothetical protein
VSFDLELPLTEIVDAPWMSVAQSMCSRGYSGRLQSASPFSMSMTGEAIWFGPEMIMDLTR